MMKKDERPLESYLYAGAAIRTMKALYRVVMPALEPMSYSTEVTKWLKRAQELDKLSIQLEERMFKDFPELSNQYHSVFHGGLFEKPYDEVDQNVLEKADRLLMRMYLAVPVQIRINAKTDVGWSKLFESSGKNAEIE